MRQWVFRWRGYVLIPTAVLALWLCQPTITSFVLGLLVALSGEALRIWGVGYSGVTTRMRKVVAPRLVTAGPYAYVRNPLYIGNFITALGFLIIAVGGIGWGLRVLLLLVTVASYGLVYAGIIIPLEEEYLARTFGNPYEEYCRHVPRLLPRPTPYPNAEGQFDWRAIQRAEIHTLGLFSAMCIYMMARMPAHADALEAVLLLLRGPLS